MLWPIVLVLAVWCFIQQRALERLQALVADLQALPRPAAAPARAVAPEPATTPVDRDDPYEQIRRALEVAKARDVELAPAAPQPLTPSEPVVVAFPQAAVEALAPVAAALEVVPTRASPSRPRLSPETWLAENGLAWLGGGALVIGGALLIGFAAQQGLFTPPVRIACAALLGVLLIAAGEAARAGRLGRFGEHPLASSIASGAGGAVLYGTAWAAHALYGFIPAGVSAALLAAIAGGLLGLALRRGQPLALLALAGAFAAPAVAAGGEWPAPAMTAYLGILVAAGLGVGAWKDWRASGWLTFAGAGLWGLLALLEPSSLKCLLLGLEPLAVTLALAQLGRLSGAKVFAGPAVVFASALGSAAMAAAGLQHDRALLYGAGAALTLVPLAALAVRLRLARGELLIGPAAAVLLAALASAFGWRGAHGFDLPALWLGQGSLLLAAGLWAVWTRGPRAPAVAFAAIVLTALGGFGGAWIGPGLAGALPPFIAALVLALGLVALARGASAKDDLITAEFIAGAAAASALLAIAFGAGWRFAPAAFAAAAVAFAAVYRRFGWRSLSGAATTSAVIAFAALFAPRLWAYAFSGYPGALWELACALLIAGCAVVAAQVIRAREDDRVLADGVATLAPVAALTGVFVFLRWFAAGGGGYLLDPLAEASLRTLLLAVSGLAALRMLTPDAGGFARSRAKALLAAAGLHGLLLQGLALNPLWGGGGRPVLGPPVLDTLALAYLAPGLLFAAAWRPRAAVKAAERAACGWTGGLFLLLWAGLEIRRIATGGDLSGGPYTVGPAEAAAYALLWLGVGGVAARLAPRAAAPLRWWGLAVAVFMLGLWSNPWFGAAARPLHGLGEALAAWLGYGLAAIVLWRRARAVRVADAPLADAAEGAAVALGLLLAGLLIRWAFRGQDLQVGQPYIGAEIWSYSAAGAGLGVMLMAARKAGRWLFRYGLALLLLTAAKVLFFDMAQLSGMVRVASFIAVGLIMLGAAMTARRMGRGGDGEVTPTPSGS